MTASERCGGGEAGEGRGFGDCAGADTDSSTIAAAFPAACATRVEREIWLSLSRGSDKSLMGSGLRHTSSTHHARRLLSEAPMVLQVGGRVVTNSRARNCRRCWSISQSGPRTPRNGRCGMGRLLHRSTRRPCCERQCGKLTLALASSRASFEQVAPHVWRHCKFPTA
jgi:hypothetical protein